MGMAVDILLLLVSILVGKVVSVNFFDGNDVVFIAGIALTYLVLYFLLLWVLKRIDKKNETEE